MHQPFGAVLQERVGPIKDALVRIRQGDGSKVELQHLKGWLLNILELVQRDPGIEAACDDLYQAAAVVVGVQGSDEGMVGARRQRLLQEALLRFQDRLATAQPNENARRMGLR